MLGCELILWAVEGGESGTNDPALSCPFFSPFPLGVHLTIMFP